MSFCTSCGANLDPAARFCTSCGKPVLAPPAAPIAAVPAPAPAQPAVALPPDIPLGERSNSLNPDAAAPATNTAAPAVAPIYSAPAVPAAAPIYSAPAVPAATTGGGGAAKVIIIVVVILVGLALLASVAGLLGFRYLARKMRVETSGDRAKVTTPFGTVTTGDAAETARNLGVEVYPGARPLPGGAAVNFGGIKTAAAEFQTPDTPYQVQSWYRARYPRSEINVSDQNQHTMVFSTSKGMVTINIEPRDNMTHIQISQVGGTGSGEQEPK
jgi:hypothetical protein